MFLCWPLLPAKAGDSLTALSLAGRAFAGLQGGPAADDLHALVAPEKGLQTPAESET